MQRTTIQWATHTVNQIRARLAGSAATKGGYAGGVGHYCEKVSPGCRGCYASAIQPRFGLPQFQEQRGANAPEVFFDVSKLVSVLRHRAPAKLFWCDMTDLFGAWVPNEWIAACFGVMAATPHITHQLLTKRAKRMREWFEWVADQGEILEAEVGECPTAGTAIPSACAMLLGLQVGKPSDEFLGMDRWRHVFQKATWPLPNVHLGVSAEDDGHAVERWAELRRCPAVVRWVSAEPLIAPIAGPTLLAPRKLVDGYREVQARFPTNLPTPAHLGAPGIDWIVVGGESGRKARPFDIAWAMSIVDECRTAAVPVFVKQLGAKPTVRLDKPLIFSIPFESDGISAVTGGGAVTHRAVVLKDGHGGDPDEWPEPLRVRQWPEAQ